MSLSTLPNLTLVPGGYGVVLFPLRLNLTEFRGELRGWATGLLLLTMLSLAGCAAAPLAADPLAPAPPTTAQAGATTIVAVAPPAAPCCPKPTLPEFLGLKGLAKGVGGLFNRVRNRLGSRFPGLEARPEVLAITDPANAKSDNPAVKEAAEAKAAEDEAPQKAKAIRYLASLGCSECYPDIEDALLSALDDCTESVRYEAAKGLRSAAGNPCQACRSGTCCSPKAQAKLRKIAYDTYPNGCYQESSDRVRRMARLALQSCGETAPAPGTTLPTEGPAEAGEPSPAAAKSSGSSLAAGARESTGGVLQPEIALTSASDEAPASQRKNVAAAIAALRESSPLTTETAATPWPGEVRFEQVLAPLDQFASRADAQAAMTLVRTKAITGQGSFPRGTSLRSNRFNWTNPSKVQSPQLSQALTTTPTGGVSQIWEDAQGLHLVRVLERRQGTPSVEAVPSSVPVSVIQRTSSEEPIQPESIPADDRAESLRRLPAPEGM